MNSMELLESFALVKDKYVLEAYGVEEQKDNIILFKQHEGAGGERETKHRISAKKSLLIAVIIATMLLIAGFAYAIVKLQELSMGEYTYVQPNPQNPSEKAMVSGEFISMQGLKDSAEYKANKEWQDYLETYDIEGVIFSENGNEYNSIYNVAYQVYAKEMEDKLMEISNKYNLMLHSKMDIVDCGMLDDMVGGTFVGSAITRGYAYIYENGTFQFDGDAMVNGKEIDFQLRRAVKGTLDEPILNIGDAKEFAQMCYETKQQETLFLALGSDQSLIYADFEECVLLLNILSGREGGLFTEETVSMNDLKAIADEIDFTLLKKVIEPGVIGDYMAGMETELVWDAPSGDGRIDAYRKVLSDLYHYQVFPDGVDHGYDGFDMEGNAFAIFDIDGDGEEELLIAYVTTVMAGMVELVYDYDSEAGKVREQFLEFPYVTYYANGIVEAGWSHNHGLGGRFWPYTLYKYNDKTDGYEEIAMVDAWDKAFSETDNDGKLFPAEIDKNGDGIIYYIMTDGRYELVNPVDIAEYESWLYSKVRDADAVKVPWMKLTEENIQKLR